MLLRIKQGDTLRLSATVLGDGVVIPGGIAAWGIRCQIRTTGGALVEELTTAITDATAGTYSMTSAGTTTYPVDDLVGDIQYTINADVIHTENFTLRVFKPQTLPVVP